MNIVKTIESKIGTGFTLVNLSDKDSDIIEKLYVWCKNTDECSHFPQLWTRFKNWENHNAFVYVLLDSNNNIAGMNAFTCNKRNPYVNCYYFEIDEKYRKQGLGNKLFFSCIEKGHLLGNTRFTLRTKDNSIGLEFYLHIGMEPRFYDPKSKEFIFDFNIEQISNIKDIELKTSVINDEPHKGRMKIYSKYEKV